MRRSRGFDSAGWSAGDMADLGYQSPRGHWASRLAPYSPPWVGAAGLYPVACLAHYAASDPAALPWVSAGLALAGAALTGTAWLAASARSVITRVHATLTSGAAALWFTSAAIADPTTPVLSWTYLLASVTVAASWNIRKLLRNSGRDGENNAGGLFEKVKLAGVRAGEALVAPNKVTVPLQLPAGEIAVEDVQKSADRLGAVMRLHQGAVRVTPDPDDLSQATMTIVPTDVLRHPQPWPGPSHPGGSICDPLVVGLYEDAVPQQLLLPGDKSKHRNATHYVVQGMNGSGKSHGAKLAWTEILTRRDACLVVLDPSKGEQTVGFLGDNTYVITGQQQCRDFMSRVPAAITAQAGQLGRWGFDQWTPEAFERHGLPYLVIWVEEAPRVLEDAATVTRIAQEARSAGMSVVLSLQKASYRQMSTDIRSQLGGVWCFGVNEIEDAAFTLSEDTIDAGARPDRWKNRRPGCNYLEGPGIDEDRFATPGRTFDATERQLIGAVADHTHLRPALLAITATALGLPTHPNSTSPAAGATTAPLGPVDDDLDAVSLPEDDDPELLPDDPEPDLHADPDTDLPEDPDLPLPPANPTRQQALAMVCHALADLADRGHQHITVRDLPDPAAAMGRSRQWLSGVLADLARRGELVEVGTDGKATVYTTPTPHAA